MNTPPEQHDRRLHPRFDVNLRVHIAQLGEVDGALTSDVSEGGLFIRTDVPHSVGSCLPVRLIDPHTAEQIPTICEVVRQVTGDDGAVVGLGLRFVHLDAYLLGRLRTFLGGVTGEPAAPEPIEIDPAEIQPLPPAAPVPADVLAMVPLDSVPTLCRGGVPPDLAPILLHLLTLIDGHRSAENVVAASGLSMAESLTGLRDLVERGLVEISVDLGPAIIEISSVPLAEEQREAKQGFVAQRARDFVADAVRAERAGRVAEAINLLEQALALKPPNAADIHVRLARMAISQLKNVGLARLHVEKLRQLSPSRDTVTKLVAEIDAREGALTTERKESTRTRMRTGDGVSVSPIRRALAAVALVAFLGATAYLVWYFWLPHGPQPRRVDPSAVAHIVPAESAQVIGDRLYVRISGAWVDLTLEQKRERLATLAKWARAEHAVQEIVVSDAVPTLVARVDDDRVTVYR